MKRSDGFTLTELMIVIGITAIMMALAAPSFQSFIHNSQLRTAVDNMQAGLILARNEAMARNSRVTLWMVNGISNACARNAAGSSWIVSLDDPAGRCGTAASNNVAPRLIQSRSGNEGSGSISLAATAADNTTSTSCITFNGFGGVEATCTATPGEAVGPAPISRVTFGPANSDTRVRGMQLTITAGGAIRTGVLP